MLNILNCNFDNNEKLLKALCSKFTHIRDYLDIILSSLTEMFGYSSELFNEIDYINIELILRTWGRVGFTYIKSTDVNIPSEYVGKLVYGFAFDGGKKTLNGIGNKVTIQLLDGHCVTRSLDECVIGFNNSTRTADRIIYWFAKQLAETDISQVNNVTYSRQAPIFVAKTNKIKQFIEAIFKRVQNGELTTIADDSVIPKGDKLVDTINLTDVTSIDKLQYLDTYHNGLLRRIYTLYGLPLSEGMKLAQQSVDEVNSNADASKVIPFNNYRMRKLMCEKLSKYTNSTITVEFSEILKNAMKREESLEDVE